MKICVFGAGAIGGYLAVRLANAGQDVSVVARGPNLAAIRDKGMRLRIGGAEEVARVTATDDAATLGPQDYVIVTLKAHSLPPVVDRLKPLFGPETAFVTAMNGVPFWYFHGLAGPWRDHRLASVDPGDRQWDVIGPERALGCVVYPACRVVEPGVIEHLDYDTLVIGEQSGAASPRAQSLCADPEARGPGRVLHPADDQTRREERDRDHDRRLEQLGAPLAERGDDGEHAHGPEHEAGGEDEREVEEGEDLLLD